MSNKLVNLIPELKPSIEYEVHDLFVGNNKSRINRLKANQNLTLRVKTSGSVRMIKLIPL